MPSLRWVSLTLGIVVLAVIKLGLSAGSARAACNNGTVTAPVLVTSPGSYDPFGGGTHSTTWSVTVENTSSGGVSCDYIVSFHRNTPGSPEFTSGLSYSLGDPLQFHATSATPDISRALRSSTLAAGASETLEFTVDIPTSQVVDAGNQTDAIEISLYEVDRSTQNDSVGSIYDGPKGTSLTVTVAEGCQLPEPDTSTLDFSGAITNALPNGTIRTATFTNIACTAASKIKLTGDAMQPAGGTATVNGFDNFINYEATGRFDDATVTLTTDNSSPGQESATSSGTSNGVTTTGSATVDIRLLSNQPILAGAYSDTLTVEVAPNP